MSRDYPPAPRGDVVEEIHGEPVADPYRWLEDPDSADTRAWLAGQDAVFAAERTGWTAAAAFRDRIGRLLAVESVSTPRARGDRLFFTRRRPGQDHPQLIVADPGGERVLLDPTALDPSGRTTLEAWEPSAEGDRLAYQLAERGTEDSVLRVLDVGTGAGLDGPIDRVRRSTVAWLPGGTAFYYVRRLASDQPYDRRVYLRRIGTGTDDDILVFGAGRNRTDHYSVALSPDGRWLTVTAAPGAAPRADVWLADLAAGGPARPEFRAVQEGVDARTSVVIPPGTEPADPIYLRTDAATRRGRICTTAPKEPDRATWTDLVPEDPAAVLTDLAVVAGGRRLLVARTEHAVGRIGIHDAVDGRPLGTVPLPGTGAIGRLAADPDGSTVWFGYTDFTTPLAVYRYDARAGTTAHWAGGGAATGGIDARQVEYPSRDGTVVRMFVISPSGPVRPRPTILTYYGGFGVVTPPAYSPLVLAWVQAGGTYAVAAVRGGGEEGEDWHRAGMRAGKQRAVDDVHAAADWLVRTGRTTHDQLGITGSSNGGLLTGAALVQHPEKYRAAVSSAPLLDLVRYERSGLGPSWTAEYGSVDDPAAFGWLHTLSPYHRVRAGTRYPAVLIAAFDGDSRVDPLHARKMCAALQHADTGGRPILLRREADVGHGARSMSRIVDVLVDLLAFFAAELGLSAGAEEPGDQLDPGPDADLGEDP